MKLLNKISDYFSLTRSERNGVIVLLTLIFFSITSLLFSQVLFDPNDETAELADDEIAEFLKSQKIKETKDIHSTKNYYSYTEKKAAYSSEKPVYHSPYPSKRAITAISLNTADTLDLQQIKGIGPAFAKRIVAYRNKLGGFVKKEQLKEVYGIDSLKYEQINRFITIDPTQITKLNINTASINELKNHPYLDYYQAKEIVKYRERHGGFKDNSELLNITLINVDCFTQVEPYISIK